MGPITDEQIIEYTWTGRTPARGISSRPPSSASSTVSTCSSEGPNGTTHVKFELSVDLKVKLPGLLLRQAQKVAVERRRRVSAEAKRRANL